MNQESYVKAVDKENPFSSAKSGYGYVRDGELVSVHPKESHDHAFHLQAHDYFREFVLNPTFACIAGQSAVRTNHYAFCCYPDMEAPEVAEGVCHDLVRYMGEFPYARPFYTFVSVFEQPQILSQIDGVGPFYTLLKNMYSVDSRHFPRSSDVSSDIESPKFGYSVGGEGFFVPFFYHFSGSEARQTKYNIVLFNSHRAFSTLRKNDAFEPLQDRIRARLVSVHPNLANHGEKSELPQYALVNPDPDSQREEREIRDKVLGRCPFGPDSNNI